MDRTLVFSIGFIFLISLSGIFSQAPSPSRYYVYRNVIQNMSTHYLELQWNINLQANSLEAAVICRIIGSTVEYCAIGFSATGSMIGSDAVIGSLGSVNDFQLNQQRRPETGNTNCPSAVCVDSVLSGCTDNVFNKTTSSTNGYLIVEFARPLNASDSCDRSITYQGVQDHLIWSMGMGSAPSGIQQHAQRGDAGQFNWMPPFVTTSPVTSSPITSSQVTSGQAALQTSSIEITSSEMTSGQDHMTTGVNQPMTSSQEVTSASRPLTSGSSPVTSHAPSITSGIGMTSGMTSGSVPSNPSGGDVQSSSSGSVINGVNPTGLRNWVLALIILGGILIIAAAVVVIVIVVKKRKHARRFGGFY